MDGGCYCYCGGVISGIQVVLHFVSVVYTRQLYIRPDSLAPSGDELQCKQGRQAAMLSDGTQKHSSMNAPYLSNVIKMHTA